MSGSRDTPPPGTPADAAVSAWGTEGAGNAEGASNAEGNPFATRYLRPGKLAYRLPPPLTWERLLERLFALRRVAIWGPHGVGKSTLLASLKEELQRRGETVRLVRVAPGQHWLSLPAAATTGRSVLMIDGFEQLWWPCRWALARRCRRAGIPCVITAHRPIRGFATLLELAPDGDSLAWVVTQLTRGWPQRIMAADVARAAQRHGPNIREALFALYDLYEQRRREAEASPGE